MWETRPQPQCNTKSKKLYIFSGSTLIEANEYATFILFFQFVKFLYLNLISIHMDVILIARIICIYKIIWIVRAF